jgi:hypothetical protein
MFYRWRITGLVLFIVFGTSACSHRVGFHPLQPPEVSPALSTAVSVHVDPQVLEASYVYRTYPYKWVIPYGPRLREFIERYFGTAFADFRLVGPSAVDSTDQLVIDLHDIEYRFVAQHAYAEIVATAMWRGKQVLAKTYSFDGWSGMGAANVGGVFAEKGVVRTSTDDVFHKIFSQMIRDLEAAVKGSLASGRRQGSPGG